MPQKWMKSIKLMLLPALFLLTLAGCGSPSVGDTYPLESVSSKDQGQTSRVYRAENKSVPVVAKELADQNKPDEISKEDSQHMFLIYPNEVYHLQQDTAKPSDTLIEIDTKEYVRNNYDSSFLQGYILASVLDDLFDGHKKSYKGSYRGYSSKDIYKPSGTYHVPTAEEKKAAPPVTTSGKGSIIKRGSTAKNSDSSVGSDGNILKKQVEPSKSSSGKIIRNSSSSSSSSSSSVTPKRSSIFSSPKSNSPPRTKTGGFGRITKRR
ncbi:DUF4247 domain-containing protein [Brevibacillus nitrificans]|uniref:DUF4247 domain-containing protein n=1 Tax=Brevibacillus nitrificans TaxID=651560 RepID=A0A3M8DSF7_9BACL|nr:DUF4247 domain-containing protein [Brevibacillus nitrificans]RNB90834.1 DUF4247 domain-containing protein [Brevibacillus nitrificans]